jgi:hypothetical protein
MVVAVTGFYGCAMDTEFVWFFICYGAFIVFPFMIPVAHASIDAVKAVTRGLRRNLIEGPHETLRPAAA